jgi:predicted nucleotidyltransferase
MVSDATIRDASRRLLEAAPNASKIVLFGSFARGDAGLNSDVDFLVVEPGPIDRRAEMVRLRRALQPLRLPVDVLVGFHLQ